MSSLGGHLNCVGGQQQKCDAVFSSKMMLKETYYQELTLSVLHLGIESACHPKYSKIRLPGQFVLGCLAHKTCDVIHVILLENEPLGMSARLTGINEVR